MAKSVLKTLTINPLKQMIMINLSDGIVLRKIYIAIRFFSKLWRVDILIATRKVEKNGAMTFLQTNQKEVKKIWEKVI